MPQNLSPESVDSREQDALRALNRTPHPYHHQRPELPYAAHHLSPSDALLQPRDYVTERTLSVATARYMKESSAPSESGTEADDEHFLKGLPAPRTKPHKGLRGQNEFLSGQSTPQLSPAILDHEGGDFPLDRRDQHPKSGSKLLLDLLRRHKILAQRAAEVANITALGLMVQSNNKVKPLFEIWGRDYQLMGLLYGSLLALYPLRVVAWAYRTRRPKQAIPLKIPSSFEPAPLIYPSAITVCASLLIATDNPAVILPNLILSICSWPGSLIPMMEPVGSYNSLHWAVSCLPLLWSPSRHSWDGSTHTHVTMSIEDMTLLYPLHQTLCVVLHHLTTTSLLTAELQLFSIALINVLALASSPQALVLKSLLWVGGFGILILCGPAIKSGIVLARVPKWRFRRLPGQRRRPLWKELTKIFSWKRIKKEFFADAQDSLLDESMSSSDDERPPKPFGSPRRVQTLGTGLETSPGGLAGPRHKSSDILDTQPGGIVRSQTLSYSASTSPPRNAQTASGRRRRAVSTSIRPFLKLTYTQAVIRKWLYALYVYIMMAVVILGGIRTHMQAAAFNGWDPIGWALGYLFGDLPWFRFNVVNANLERWICLPSREDVEDGVGDYCQLGWVQRLRHNDFGEGNTRLIIGGYWALIFIVGLLTVFRLSSIYEVDTRRKVFHFMMVGMLLPATYVDPAFTALSLSMVLGVFLILDLLRASQLPPLSKPIASFLAPYVDGRDFRGPVVISHIFLLIGCAIPLWLALAALPRTGTGCSVGWEIPTREVSMVSGVICVGLGDAAASLIGRRYGRRKWLWGGGKSLEGSVAFAAAVFAGLAFATAWLRVGGWPVADEQGGILRTGRNAGACASMASLTEAVLTGGNDNVIVPVVLWTCVKSLAI